MIALGAGWWFVRQLGRLSWWVLRLVVVLSLLQVAPLLEGPRPLGEKR